ncbi:hypothetical protein DFP72DRAFT_1165487 [Ephemerocybe angulata]|uniref:Uncharacterized protein n=1 Tax=Ephemerocybe angulata TaxID=980116 RepID=A0A8H6IC71_9AGAR|nr:hypothetical protein DFP72DRAFT_1165487 [Tulosesus angulatus]
MSAQTRWFIADDRDGSISYSGSWTSIDGSQYNGEGNFGQTYLNTLHRTTTTSSVSFTFTGDAARIMGTTAVKNAKSKPDPDWKCYLNGAETQKEAAFEYTENNWSFCKFYDLPAGKHTVRIDITTSGQPFLFDQIQYKPTVSVNDAVAFITRYDADLVYDSSWQGLGDVGRMTTVQGSKATFSFIGNRLTWVAMYPHQLPHGDSQATYSIDNGSPVSFTIRGGGDGSDYNRQVFQTPKLSQGKHTLAVTYLGSSSVTPLVITSLIVEGGSTQLLGTVASTPASGGGTTGGNTGSSGTGNGNSGSGSTGTGGGSSVSGESAVITTVLKDGTTTTTAVPALITVTKVSDADSDVVPNGDNIEKLVSGTLDIHNGTPTLTGGVTVYTVDANGVQQVAGNPNDQGSNKGTGSTVGAAKNSGFPVAAIVGIVLGLLLALLLAGLFFYWRRNRKRRLNNYQHPENLGIAQGSTAAYGSNMGMRGDGGSSMAASLRSGMAAPPSSNRLSFSSGTASDFAGASSQSNLLQPVRKNRDPFANPESAGEGSSTSRVVVHEGSGIRMASQARPVSIVEEVPPHYTPG